MVSERNYWTSVHQRRLNRRRLLQGAALGAAGLAGAGLVGCGGGDEGPSPTTGPSATAAKQPTKGGVFRGSYGISAPPSIDPYKFTTISAKRPCNYVYSRLFQFDSGPQVARWKFPVVPDAAESYEVTPDGLTWSVKLKGNVRFTPPLDRLMDAEDVVFSAKRFLGMLPGYAGAQNRDQLTSLVSDVQAADARTVLFKLKKPYGRFLLKLADGAILQILPKETGTAFNPEQTMVGSGPWVLEKYDSGSMIRFRRNPIWHFGPERPYLDATEYYWLANQTMIANQFKAGNLDVGTTPESPQAMKEIEAARPGVTWIGQPGGWSPYAIWMSLDDEGAPWLKQEVRQAVSMAIDRKALQQASYKQWEDAGYEVKYGWDNVIPMPVADYWLDPQGKDAKFGKYFAYDPEGAKKILADAGYPEGFSVKWQQPNVNLNIMWEELLIQMLAKVGIKVEMQTADFVTVYIPQVQAGKFDGWAMGFASGSADPIDYLSTFYRSSSPRNFARLKDPVLEAKLDKMESTLDEKAFRQEILDVQNYMNEKMYVIPYKGGQGGVGSGYAPKVRNAYEYYNAHNAIGLAAIGPELLAHVWIDG